MDGHVRFDSLWLSEVLTGPGPDPVVGLAWAAASNPRLMVIDFKTDAEIAGELQRYRRQVALYSSVVARTTEKAVTAVLMQL